MKKELEEKLVKEFPNLFRDWRGDPQRTCMAWGVAFGDGWFDIFYDLCKKLNGLEPHMHFDQCKEKFGTARVYFSQDVSCSCGTQSGPIFDLVDEFEKKSATVCEWCGKSGEIREDLPWIRTLCDDCYRNKKKADADIAKEFVRNRGKKHGKKTR